MSASLDLRPTDAPLAPLSPGLAGAPFDRALLNAARRAGCRGCTPRLLAPAERDARRAALLELWRTCSPRIVDESLLADLHARRPETIADCAVRARGRPELAVR